jgi:long-chain acyl-CoA synthetase
MPLNRARWKAQAPVVDAIRLGVDMASSEASKAAQTLRPTLREPLAERLIGPGKAYELEVVDMFGRPQEVFRGAPRTLTDVYRRSHAFADRVMLVQDGASMTYGEVFARSGALADTLRGRFGIGLGDKVAVVTSNRPEWVLSLIAVTSLGGVAVLVNSRGVAEEMLRAITLADCKLVILDRERAEIIAATRPDPEWPRLVIGADPSSLRPGKDFDFDALSQPAPGQILEMNPEITAETGAMILFTSGTTGFPKAALISHGATAHTITLSGMMGQLQDLRYELEIGPVPPSRRAMASPLALLSPLFHLSGIMPIIRGLSTGIPIHIINKWNVDVAFDTIETVGISRLGFVPTMLWDMLRSPRAGDKNLGSILYLSNGGAAMNAALLQELQRTMPKAMISNTYGQTENASWATSICGKPYLAHPNSCGWAAPTVRVSIRRADGAEADIGELGEVWVTSPGIMTEYYNDPKATAATLEDGWCKSGDIGHIDAEGIVTIVDRMKNMVISGGENIYCAEIERVLMDHPRVREAIAYGLPDPRLGEKVAVIVVLEPGAAPGGELTPDGFKAYCKQHLAIYKVPREVTVTTEALPRIASGKIDRTGITRQAREAVGA